MAFLGFINPLRRRAERGIELPLPSLPVPERRQWLVEVQPWHESLVAHLREFFNPPRKLPVPPYVPGAQPYRAPRIDLEVRPWHDSFFATVRELLSGKRRVPPLRVTSKPVKVAELWETRLYQQQLRRTQVISLAVHATLLLLVAIPLGQRMAPASTTVSVELGPVADISPYTIALPPSARRAGGGGGGGGDRTPLPASKGRLPKRSLEQLTPPVAVIRNPYPELAVEPSVIVPPELRLQQPNIPQYGDPLAQALALSGGPGGGSGIGSGAGGGVGSGWGPGVGPGWGGGAGGGVYRIGGNVSAPICLFCPEPEYSEAARKAKWQGLVVLVAVVGPDGRVNPESIVVVRPVGMDLDEKAVRAVQQWRFKPAQRFGKPVAVRLPIEVNFRLL
ncbi:MAG: energy transducer TonB [Terriglobia bacterium]